MNKKTSVIITTHLMEEAELLSKRLAIIADGELKCIGNKQYLKDKFGKGYEIDIKTKIASNEQTNELIKLSGMIPSTLHFNDFLFFRIICDGKRC